MGSNALVSPEDLEKVHDPPEKNFLKKCFHIYTVRKKMVRIRICTVYLGLPRKGLTDMSMLNT